MAYDEQLANRIRRAFSTRRDVTERKMFGGLAFLVRGRMCCGIVGNDLMVRISDVARCHRVAFDVAYTLSRMPMRCSFAWSCLARPGRVMGREEKMSTRRSIEHLTGAAQAAHSYSLRYAGALATDVHRTVLEGGMSLFDEFMGSGA